MVLVGHCVLHKPWPTLLADYDITRGRICIAVLITTLLAPLSGGPVGASYSRPEGGMSSWTLERAD
jgi:hypothetical protein